jgi:Spy/CpxP family protein refolding chaperone
MNDSSKIKLLYGIVAILIVLNISVIGFITTHHPHRPGGVPHAAEAVVRELQFTPEQQKQFDILKTAHHNALEPVHEQGKRLHDAMFAQLSDGRVTGPVADSLIDAIGENVKLEEQITYRHLAQLRKVCTPEQQKKFDEILLQAMKGGRDIGPPPQRD